MTRPGSGPRPWTTWRSTGSAARRRPGRQRRRPSGRPGGAAAPSTTPRPPSTARAARTRTASRSIWEGEDGEVRTLHQRGAARRGGPRRGHAPGPGVAAGDRVGICLPMLPETVVAVLALGKLRRSSRPSSRATARRPSPRRLADCEATLLITADGFYRRGGGRAAEARRRTRRSRWRRPFERVLVVRRLGGRAWAPRTCPGPDGRDPGGTRRWRTPGDRARHARRRRPTPRRPT